MENTVNYLNKIIEFENYNFFIYLREKGLICDSVSFHEKYKDYQESGFGRESKEFGSLYLDLNQELDKVSSSKKRNAYINFSKSVRDKIKNENPELKGREVTLKISEIWKSMDKKEKEKYK